MLALITYMCHEQLGTESKSTQETYMLHTRGINGKVQNQVHFFPFHNLCNQEWQVRSQPFEMNII
jgi:hypothetical protein